MFNTTGIFVKKIFCFTALSATLSCGALHAIKFDRTPTLDEQPWFTGTFIAYGPVCLDPGVFNVQFYMSFLNSYAQYNNRGRKVDVPDIFEMTPFFTFFQTGILHDFDISLTTQALYEQSQGLSDVHWGPTSLSLGYQIMRSMKDTPIPNIRFLLNGVFPSGPFDGLGAQVKDIGAGTNGSYQIGPTLVVQKIFYSLMPGHPISINLNFGYLYQTHVVVRGFNFYGGTAFSKGAIKPTSIWNVNLATEISLTRNIAIGTDINYNYTGRIRYTAIEGDVDLSQPAAQVLSLTPMLEYNFSVNMGAFIAGWISLWGQNTAVFGGGVVSAFFTF